jgi:membrane dipeptidase
VIVDGHEDVAFNVLADGRDYLTSAPAVRAAEAGTDIEETCGQAMLGLEDWLDAEVGLILTTLLTVPRLEARHGELSYATVEGAHQQALAQLDVYRRMAAASEYLVPVRTRAELEGVTSTWTGEGHDRGDRRIGFVLLIENGDPIRTPDEVAFWADQGVRVIGPAWHSNRYSGSTKGGGPLTALGRDLLSEMERLGMVLDVTHMSDEATREAFERFDGAVVASHAHSRRTVPIDRLLPDAVIAEIAARDGVVGVMPLNWALVPGWHRSDGKSVPLAAVVDAIDTVCELTGDVRHVGLGTDFDGGQGAESAPAELDTIADLPRLGDALSVRGYADAEVAAILGGNWLRVLRANLA